MYVKVRDNTGELWVGFGPGDLRLGAGYKEKEAEEVTVPTARNKSAPLPVRTTCCTKTTVTPTVKPHTCQTLLALIVNARMINKTVSRVLLCGV